MAFPQRAGIRFSISRSTAASGIPLRLLDRVVAVPIVERRAPLAGSFRVLDRARRLRWAFDTHASVSLEPLGAA